MLNKLRTQPNTLLVLLISAFALGLNFYAAEILNASYAASLFPVPYYEAQLSFSPEKLQGWYAYLIEQGTLTTYIQTQHIDFIFIVSVLLLHFFALLLVSRLFSASGRVRGLLIVCALLSTAAPLADALENLVSYIMLANPDGFAGWLAYVYSSFAAIKFAMFTFFYAVMLLALPAGLFVVTRQKLSAASRCRPEFN